MKKAIVIFLIIIIVLYLIPTVTGHIISYSNRTRISNIIRNNLDFLNGSIDNGSYKDALEINGIEDMLFLRQMKGTLI